MFSDAFWEHFLTLCLLYFESILSLEWGIRWLYLKKYCLCDFLLLELEGAECWRQHLKWHPPPNFFFTDVIFRLTKYFCSIIFLRFSISGLHFLPDSMKMADASDASVKNCIFFYHFTTTITAIKESKKHPDA